MSARRSLVAALRPRPRVRSRAARRARRRGAAAPRGRRRPRRDDELDVADVDVVEPDDGGGRQRRAAPRRPRAAPGRHAGGRGAQAAHRDRRRLRRLRLLRDERRRHGVDPGPRPEPLLPRRGGQVLVGVPRRPARARHQQPRRGRRPRQPAGRDALQPDRLGRRAELHRQRGQPHAQRRRGRQRARDGELGLHAALGHELLPRRRLRGRPRAARVDAGLAPHVDLRRQDGVGDRPRVPLAQGAQSLRRHAVAHRALHDGHAARREVPQQARRRRLADRRGRAHQRLVDDRAVSLLRRDRQQRGQDRLGPRRRRARRASSRSASRASTARRTTRSTAPTRCGSWTRTSSSTSGPSR